MTDRHTPTSDSQAKAVSSGHALPDTTSGSKSQSAASRTLTADELLSKLGDTVDLKYHGAFRICTEAARHAQSNHINASVGVCVIDLEIQPKAENSGPSSRLILVGRDEAEARAIVAGLSQDTAVYTATYYWLREAERKKLCAMIPVLRVELGQEGR